MCGSEKLPVKDMHLTTSETSRLQSICRILEEQQLDALIAFNNGQNLFLDANAVFVLTGVRPLAESAVVIGRDGISTLIVMPAWDGGRATRITRSNHVMSSDDLPAALRDALRRHRIDPKKCLTTGLQTLGNGLVCRIEAALGGKPLADKHLIAELARVRSPEERAAAQRATEIAERGYERMLEVARPGLREYELAAELYCAMKRLGAEDNFLLVSASQHNLAVRAAGNRRLDIGDIILSEITPCFHGQFAQLCRTTVIGRPSALLEEKYAVLQAAMRRGQAAAVPGAAVRDVTAVMDDCFREAGYGDYCRPPYMRVRGHGLGITSDQPGDITADSNVKLEEGMIFVMHPNQYLPETGYLMCGEPVVITRGGAEALSARRAALDFVPA